MTETGEKKQRKTSLGLMLIFVILTLIVSAVMNLIAVIGKDLDASSAGFSIRLTITLALSVFLVAVIVFCTVCFVCNRHVLLHPLIRARLVSGEITSDSLEQKELLTRELQSKLFMQQVADMQESIENAKRIRHDVHHHNMQVIEYARKGELDKLLSYLGQYEKEVDSHIFVTLCENHAANNILNVYTRKAKQQGIEVHLDISMEQNIIISDTDLVAMLANLMENAIEGCMQSGKSVPFIKLHICRKASKLSIFICNSAGDDVSLENGLPKSKSGDSIGVSSILHSAARYGGEYDFQIKDGVFSCQLLLKMSEKI